MKQLKPFAQAIGLVIVLILSGCGPTESASDHSNEHDANVSKPVDEAKQGDHSGSTFEDVEKKYGVPPNPHEWSFSPWSNSNERHLSELKGHVVVVRFWTNTCPYCARSMPALQRLKEKLRDEPVTFIGAYHSKPFGSDRPWSSAVEMTENWGVTFPVAYDRNWSTLRKWWLSTGDRQATSCTFVFNKRGRITYIHPGPVYEPGDPSTEKPARDYHALKQAIQHALARKTSNQVHEKE